MAPVFSKPALIEVVETSSSALAASDGHHKHAVVLVVVAVAIAGATIIYLAYRLVTRYLKEGREPQDLETIDVLAIQDAEKGSDTRSPSTSSPFVFVPADTTAIEAKPVPAATITHPTPSDVEITGTPPLISAFSPHVEIEDTDDQGDVEAAPETNPDPFALFTRPSPNMLNFWMKPDPAFIRAGAATGRKLVIGGKTFILDEVVVKRRVFAEKTVSVQPAAEVGGDVQVEECVAQIEEWPVHDVPTEPATPEDTPTPRMEEQKVVARDAAVVGELVMKGEDCPAQDGAVPTVAASETMPSMESIPNVASTPSPPPISSGKSSSKFLRKPLATLKTNIPLLQGASKKPSTPLKPTGSTARAPSRPLPNLKVMAPRTPAKSAVNNSAMKKSGSLPLASRGSVTSHSAGIFEPAKKSLVPLSSTIKKSASLPSSSKISPLSTPKSGKKLLTKPTTPPVLIPSPRATIFSIPEITSPLRGKSKRVPPDVSGTPKGGLSALKFKRSSSLGGKMGVGLTPRTPPRPLPIWR